MRTTIKIALILSLAGCAGSRANMGDVQNVLDSWSGGTRDALIKKWGPPHRAAETSYGETMVYEYCQTTGGQVVQNYTRKYDRRFDIHVPVRSYCETWTFELKDGRIAEAYYRGG